MLCSAVQNWRCKNQDNFLLEARVKANSHFFCAMTMDFIVKTCFLSSWARSEDYILCLISALFTFRLIIERRVCVIIVYVAVLVHLWLGSQIGSIGFLYCFNLIFRCVVPAGISSRAWCHVSFLLFLCYCFGSLSFFFMGGVCDN